MGTNLPDPIGLFLVLAALGLAPILAVLVTSFAKIVVVLNLTRNALGVQQVPPSMVINSLALMLTCYVMAPIGVKVFDSVRYELESRKPDTAGIIIRTAEVARGPLTAFLEKHAAERERRFFEQAARKLWPKELADQLKRNDLLVLVPAFLITELGAAYVIGFIIYLAFIVVDFIVASILLALGMSMISPTVVSVPFKLLLFVVLDGWSLLVHNLILTYR